MSGVIWGATVIDCPDPIALGRFYASLLGCEAIVTDTDWVDVVVPGAVRLSFQQVENFVPPSWPSNEHPPQAHLDFDVADLDQTERFALSLGATKASDQPGESFRVFVDPAGHPFCLVLFDV